jgi:hypothetical protein
VYSSKESREKQISNFDAEKEYIDAYEKNKLATDISYGFKVLINVLTGRARTY